MHSSLDQKNQELWLMAHHDPLTGVLNRRAYDDDWRQLASLIRGQDINISVILLDCDHFKAINDTYGHAIGDNVIKAVAECLKTCVREHDKLYRIGGDEFAIHMTNTSADEAAKLAVQCQQSVEKHPFRELGIKEPVRFSVGLSSAKGTQPEQICMLHKQADIAMYQAKGPSYGKVVQYEKGMEGQEGVIVSNRYIHAVYDAIENGKGIILHFQPIISFNPTQPNFYEVLTRLTDNEGMIMPSHIFPVVHAENLDMEFDLAILSHLKSQFDNRSIPEDITLSVNLGGTSLVQPRILESLKSLCSYLDTYHIILEVTETALITELHKATEVLTELRSYGYKVALDDFGSGYSSLRYLASMPVDIVKFDISMVRALESNDTQRQIAVDVARMILAAGYELVAEGVEDEKMLRLIEELGFTHAQGFLLGRPSENFIHVVQQTELSEGTS
jgi:diguanylate cyclase (GGDEF)-like protein